MNFGFTPAQDELYDRARRWAEKELSPVCAPRGDHSFSREAWRACGAFGLLGLSVPEALGGMGLDALTTARVLEAAGRGCADAGLLFSASAHLFACVMPIVEHGTPELCARLVPALCSGASVGANAITEADAGSDVFALKATAVRDGDHYRLDGTKSYVTNGPVADVFVTYAMTDPSARFLGITAFVVERGTPGLVVGAPFDKVGLETSPCSSIYFDGCRVPATNVLGREGGGAAIFTSSMMWERACLFSTYVGAMERQIEQAVAYARGRRQFGKPIGKNQGVSHKIANMKLRLESARLLLYRACWLRDQGKDATLEISLSKLAISEAAVQAGLDAIQLHGGTGIMSEAGIDRALRDALPSTVFSGTSEIMRDLIAKHLGL